MDGRQFSSMAALGRLFKLGDFYDYRADCIIKDDATFSEFSGMTSAVLIDEKKQLGLDCESQNKWEQMGLDEHLQASVTSGLIDKFSGASTYLVDTVYPSQITKTLAVRIKLKKEFIDMTSFMDKYSSQFSDVLEKKNSSLSEATHFVIGVAYGSDIYLVVAHDAKEDDEDAREEVENYLSELLTKFENALEDKQDLSEFKEQFDKEERQRLTQVKCRLFADLEKKVQCNLFDAYKHCLKLINNREEFVPVNIILFPLREISEEKFKEFQFRDIHPDLTARCCRIWDNLEKTIGKAKAIQTTLKKSDRAPFVQFEEILLQFGNLLKLSLKKKIVFARLNMDGDDEEVEKILDIAENHLLFNENRLQQWFSFKSSELEITGKMAAGMNFLASKVQLEKAMADSFDKKYALVLTVPAIDQKSKEIVEKMKDHLESYKKLTPYEDDEEEEDEELPWHMIPSKRMQVLGKIREFSDFIGKNKETTNQVQFFVTIGDVKSGFSCRYSVYESGRLLKENISELPSPPAGLRIHLKSGRNKSSTKFQVEWEYEELGFPCHFVVEYRTTENSDCWKQQKTTKASQKEVSISCKRGLAMEFRVAADSCIGRSEFSETVDSETVLDGEDDCEFMDCDTESVSFKSNVTVTHQQQSAVKSKKTENGTTKSSKTVLDSKSTLPSPSNLEVDWITQTKADLSWSRPPKTAGKPSYRVYYWPNDQQDPSLASEMDVESSETGCRLEDLQSETTYSVYIVAVSSDGKSISLPSNTVTFTTLNEEIRFAENVVKHCKNIGKRNGMDLYAVPLTKSTGSGKTARRFAFGKADGKKGRMQHRTILVMGATGSGKTTLINGMINYIFNVVWEDTFRFQLIQEQVAGRSQVDSQTSQITAYDIHHMEGFRVPYSLTIVDTPGYGDTKGLDRDQEITEMVRKFFEDKDGIQELDVVGFVAQASLPRLTPTQIYIFDSVLSIFGNDVKENINFLLTFADSQVPPVLSAISAAGLPCPTDEETGHPLHHKFNNSGFFCSSRESGPVSTGDKFNRFFWRMGLENFQKFFSVLATMKTKSLSLTKQVLDERKTLEATVDGLQPLIKTGLTKMEEMRKTKQMISNCQAQIEANENVEFEVEVTMPKKVENRYGGYLTNCNRCYVTCHNPCAIPNDDGKVNCASMDHSMPAATRSCKVCPEKCIWNMHANQPYSWEYVKEKQATSSDAIKQKYEAELKRKLTAEELIKELQKDVDANEKTVLDRVAIVARCIEQLDKIALRPNPFSTPQYIDLIIDAEQQEKRPGFKERIESLKKLRQMAVITTKVRNKESLLKQDRKEDLDDETDDEEEDDQDADEKDETDDDDSSTSTDQWSSMMSNKLAQISL